MFTGLVDDVGTIAEVQRTDAGLEFRIDTRYADLGQGDSVSVNGACLTVRSCGPANDGRAWFSVAAVSTSLARTTIADWKTGDRVNLERAMQLGERLGGHVVLGHVDDVAIVTEVARHGDALLIDLRVPAPLRPLMAPLGSVAVDGVSLTVNAVLADGIQISLIDYTLRHTTLSTLKVHDRVHIEGDMLAKHVERLLAAHVERLNARTQP